MIRSGIELVCFKRKPGRDWGVSRRLAGAIEDRQIEVIHAHQYSLFFYAALARPLVFVPPGLILTNTAAIIRIMCRHSAEQ